MGPFGTADVLSWGPRTVYWMAVPAVTYAIGYGFGVYLAPRLHAALDGTAARVVLALMNSTVITGTIFGLNYMVFGIRPTVLDGAIIFGITLLISFLIELLPSEAPDGEAQAATATPPPILDRLPLDKRGPLVALSVEDHYVRIRTTKGEDMVLLRLSDAVREVGDTSGLRVHRSHWVAVAQVIAAERKGDGAVLSMATGGDIPVSRSHMPAIREAGLLPR